MKSCAEELMEYCEKKGVGKIGEDLFYTISLNDLRRFESFIFRDVQRGFFERRLDGIVFEVNYVEIQIRGDFPDKCYSRLSSLIPIIEKMKGHKSKSKVNYESVLVSYPPTMVTFNTDDKFVYFMLVKVMRNSL